MSKNQSYFSIGNKIFWGLILLVILFALLKLNPGLFKGDNIAREIIVEDSLSKINWDGNIVEADTSKISDDSLSVQKDEYINRTWKWKSFDDKNYILNYRIKRSDYSSAINCRKTSNPGTEIWSRMYNNDKMGLSEMVDAYRDIIRKNNLGGMDALNMVVSSVQNNPYVLITTEECPENAFGMDFTNDCRPRENSPGGCCGFVLPFAVYSPIEYAVNGSGDCDTKSLFACTILKELNLGYYDVEMLTGNVDAGAHAMLGISIVNPPFNNRYVTDIRSTKYYAWEITSKGNELGQNVWNTWNNWEVIYL